jgi:hypothetical protein
MTCSDVHDKLIDYLYGELDADAARAVDAHAQGCPTCAAALEGLSATLVATRSALRGPLDQRPPTRAAGRARRLARRAGEIWPLALLRVCIRWLQRPLFWPVLGATAIAVLGITLQITSRPDLRERYALAPPPSPVDPRTVQPAPRAAPEPTVQGELAPAAEGRAANAAPPQNIAEQPAGREYATAPPARGMQRSDEFSASARPQQPARPRAAAARRSARRVPAATGPVVVADTPLLAEEEAPLVADAEPPRAAEAEPRASAATTSNLRAELVVDSATSAASPAAPAKAAPAPALRPLLQRADRAFRNKRWGTAAAAYQQLLRSYPAHRSAPLWQRRLDAAETSLEGR